LFWTFTLGGFHCFFKHYHELKMKKKFKIIIPVTIALLVSFMVYKIVVKLVQKEKIAAQIQNIPNFKFSNVATGNIFSNVNLLQGMTMLIIHFNPDCEYCQEQATAINKQITKFDNCQLLFISSAKTTEIIKFSDKYGLSGRQNIFFLQDKDYKFKDIFGISGVPSSFVYNKQGKLVKQFKGEARIEELLKYLEN